jgi:cell division protein FtsQ
MNVVSQLLSDAQLAAEHLYHSWQIVSLARLESDDEIEITTKDNTTIIFSAKRGFFVQLANLDVLIEKISGLPPARVRIDLSLGREVPVMVEPVRVPLEAATVPKPAPARSFFSASPRSQ